MCRPPMRRRVGIPLPEIAAPFVPCCRTRASGLRARALQQLCSHASCCAFLSADLFDGIFLLSQALEAFSLLSRTEGIIPALETSHAIAHLEVQGIHTSWRGSPCTC